MQNPASDQSQRPRLLYVVTCSSTVAEMRGQLRYMAAAGFEVTVASAPGEELEAAARHDGVSVYPIPLERDASLLADLRALKILRALMRDLKPHITNVSTTKAGFIGGLAARMAGVPVRIYVQRGIGYETATGARRWLMKKAESMACGACHRALCVSASVRKRLELDGMLQESKAAVLASGSSNGVEAERFAPTGDRTAHGLRIRHELKIPQDAVVVGYVGRLTPEQGLPDLVAAYDIIKRGHSKVRLLVVGANEKNDKLPAATKAALVSDKTVHCVGAVPDAAPYYHAMDVLALPSHGEGFPNVVLEAYAAGKPVVATRATGAIDAVIEDGTGMLVPVGDIEALAETLVSLLRSPTTRKDMGEAGQRWVNRDFRPVRIWRELEKEYRRLLTAANLPLPTREPVTTTTLEAKA